jgi:hypothetical protein
VSRGASGVGHWICTSFVAMRDHASPPVRRDYDDEDPKKPRPVQSPKKGSNAAEAAEHGSWWHTRKDFDRDRHRHVV